VSAKSCTTSKVSIIAAQGPVRGHAAPRLDRSILFWFVAAALLASGLAARAHAANPLNEAAERYRPFMVAEIDQALAGARTLHQRVTAKDLAGAQQAWVEARVGWERAEVFTNGYVSELDELIDAWPNAITGFHAIEAKLFGAKNVDVGDETSALIYHLADLDVKIHYTPLNAQDLLNGTARLAYEVGENKADGGESRFSGTSLDDMRNNVFGIALAYKTVFQSALQAADPKLAASTQKTIEQLRTLVAVPDLKSLESDKLRNKSEDLVIALQSAAPKLGLIAPTLEDLTQ
jgi:iron uptake system component EfeO